MRCDSPSFDKLDISSDADSHTDTMFQPPVDISTDSSDRGKDMKSKK